MIEIVPTCVARDVSDLASCVQKTRAFSQALHVDVDDGLFAPHLTWPYTQAGVFDPFDLSALAGISAEVHLMVEEPREIGIAFARAGASRIIGHVEAFPDATAAHGALDAWRQNGASEAGLGLLMDTPFEVVEPLVPACDIVHFMSIATIGTQGIPYDPRASVRIAAFHVRFPAIVISVDGGVSEKNIEELVRAGATHFGIGSAIMRSENPASAYERLKSLAESALE
jgi:ribulose-phosphate 3-epimerase